MNLATRNDLPVLVGAHRRLIDRGVLRQGEQPEMEVRHDPWCPILRGQWRCTCAPEVWYLGRRVD